MRRFYEEITPGSDDCVDGIAVNDESGESGGAGGRSAK
jgi:hypothetical protein